MSRKTIEIESKLRQGSAMKNGVAISEREVSIFKIDVSNAQDVAEKIAQLLGWVSVETEYGFVVSQRISQ